MAPSQEESTGQRQRVLVCGLCPLPFENTSQNYGPGIRTWQLAKAAALGGHEVRVLAMVIPGVYEGDELASSEEIDGITIRRLDGEAFHDPDVLRAEIARWRPSVLVGATVYGSLVIAEIEPELPFWADQFGHVMAEAQAKAALEGENWPIPRWWRMVRPILSRADKISTVSTPQRYAAIGELGAVGRLTAQTCGYEFTAVIPCGLDGIDPASEDPAGGVVKGSIVPDDAFVVLWSGGYNVWSDIETLFAGLERAMAKEPSIYFVSTGGAISGHDESTYARFEELIAGSQHRDRFHLAGWLKREEVPAYVAEADLGVLADRPMYEGMLGSKNRIVQWMVAGLPAAYNRVGEIGEYLEAGELGLTFEVGDSEALARHLVWAANHRHEVAAMARRAREACLRDFSLEAATMEFRRWVAAPRRAPDHRRGALRSPFDYDEIPAEPIPEDPLPKRIGWKRRWRSRLKRFFAAG